MISIIMPAYNSSLYISRAIKSLQNLTYADWELCMVDDASTDNTIQVVENFMREDKRIKLEFNKTNLGCGLARRRAIAMAKGEYVFFLDSDDWIEPYTLEDLLKISIYTNSDVVICGVFNHMNDEYMGQNIAEKAHSLSGLDLYKEFIRGIYIMPYNCNKLFRKTVIDTYEYSDLRFCEDTLTCAHWLWNANKAFIINKSYYHYCLRKDSNSNTKNDRITKSYCTVKCFIDHVEFCEKYNLTEIKEKLLLEVYERLCFCILFFPIESEEYKFCDNIRNKYYVRKNN